MDIKKQRWVRDGQGNQASEDAGDYVSRSGSWQYGANVPSQYIDSESQEEDLKFGVPNEEVKRTRDAAPQTTSAYPDSYEKGGIVKKGGMAKVHAGEKVIPAPKSQISTLRKGVQQSQQSGNVASDVKSTDPATYRYSNENLPSGKI
jgi:hypothetical protein